MTFSLENKSAIITGAASGIGRAAAIRFAQAGAKVCVADLNIEGAEAVAKEIGSSAFAFQTDVTNESSNNRCVEAAIDAFGSLDIAFLNAGYLGPMEGFDSTNEELFDRHYAINLKGVFFGLKAVKSKISNGGSVIVTASTAGIIGLAESPAYSAVKHGVIGLVKASTPAFAERGVRVNALCPGAVSTPMLGDGDTLIVDPEALNRVPLRDKGSAQHIAEAALWLAHPASGFVNGQAHIVDAGLLSTFVPSPTVP